MCIHTSENYTGELSEKDSCAICSLGSCRIYELAKALVGKVSKPETVSVEEIEKVLDSYFLSSFPSSDYYKAIKKELVKALVGKIGKREEK